MISTTTDDNNDQHGGGGDMISSKKECTSCEQTEVVNNITEGIDSIAIHDMSTCANCGKEGNRCDMNTCNKCKSVKYCNAACKKKHKSKHKKACEKRVAELHDIELFKQPPSQWGDCPICFLRLPCLATGSTYYSCCGKIICSGCSYAPLYDNQGNKVDNKKCPFCRTPCPVTEDELIERGKKRVDLDDPIVIFSHGVYYKHGRKGFPQDMDKALELWHRAAELGHSRAYNSIGFSYNNGVGVEVDKKKAKYYFELASMKGYATARYNLGLVEEKAGNMNRALMHYLIAASSGYDGSLVKIKQLYSDGLATKEDYTKALQLYQAYLGEIKSVQRDKAFDEDGEDCRYY